MSVAIARDQPSLARFPSPRLGMLKPGATHRPPFAIPVFRRSPSRRPPHALPDALSHRIAQNSQFPSPTEPHRRRLSAPFSIATAVPAVNDPPDLISTASAPVAAAFAPLFATTASFVDTRVPDHPARVPFHRKWAFRKLRIFACPVSVFVGVSHYGAGRLLLSRRLGRRITSCA